MIYKVVWNQMAVCAPVKALECNHRLLGSFSFVCSLRMIMDLPVPKPVPGAIWLVKRCSVITHINSQGDHLLKYVVYIHGIMNKGRFGNYMKDAAVLLPPQETNSTPKPVAVGCHNSVRVYGVRWWKMVFFFKFWFSHKQNSMLLNTPRLNGYRFNIKKFYILPILYSCHFYDSRSNYYLIYTIKRLAKITKTTCLLRGTTWI